MEYMHLGDLESNVIAHSGRIPENEARDITQQILSGLEIMHTESFAHRDLKPQVVFYIPTSLGKLSSNLITIRMSLLSTDRPTGG
jgi:serine/threonine protein kinase